MSSKKVGKPEKKIGEREKLRKALPLKESVEGWFCEKCKLGQAHILLHHIQELSYV